MVPRQILVAVPVGVVELHENVPVNHRVEIVEGQKEFKATAFQPVQPLRLRAGKSASQKPFTEVSSTKASSETVRNWLIAPLYGPDVKLPDLKGEVHSLSGLRGRPVLLNFFRMDCGDSRKQLDELQKASAALSAAGVSVLAVAFNSGPDRVAIESLARTSDFNFPILMGDEHTAGAWNIQYRYLFDRRRDMNLPMSFLLDPTGAIIRIYQGIVAGHEVVDDWKSAPAGQEQRFAKAMPFPGPYYGNPMRRDYFTYGIAFIEYGYVDEAQAAFQRVVEADPNHAGAWFNLGTIYLNKKSYAEARKSLSEAVRLNPQDADAWNNLGMVSGEEEKYDEALDEFHRAALANPNYLVAVQNMLQIYQFQSRAVDAQKALEELVQRAPNNPDLHLGLAMALIAQNDTTRALQELETAVRLQPDNTDALNNLGALLQRLGRNDEALARLEQCRRLAPDFDRPYINSALIYSQTGQSAKARELLEEFLTRHPDNTDVQSALEKLGPK